MRQQDRISQWHKHTHRFELSYKKKIVVFSSIESYRLWNVFGFNCMRLRFFSDSHMRSYKSKDSNGWRDYVSFKQCTVQHELSVSPASLCVWVCECIKIAAISMFSMHIVPSIYMVNNYMLVRRQIFHTSSNNALVLVHRMRSHTSFASSCFFFIQLSSRFKKKSHFFP